MSRESDNFQKKDSESPLRGSGHVLALLLSKQECSSDSHSSQGQGYSRNLNSRRNSSVGVSNADANSVQDSVCLDSSSTKQRIVTPSSRRASTGENAWNDSVGPGQVLQPRAGKTSLSILSEI